uniref:F-box protein 36a n=1 Tax=Fundulus heteroclitus TaxID=8078 RepID=A0A3Q2SQU1_FUNHE
MASLIGEKLFEINGQGPPPTKDFFQLVITRTEVTWTSWTISLRRESKGAPPKQLKTTHCGFLQDKPFQNDVGSVFGQRILEYTLSLCRGDYDYLERLPDDIALRILSFLPLEDTALVAQVSHRFRQLCNSETFWEQTVRNRCADFNSEMEGLANAMGWRRTYFTFFHKKNEAIEHILLYCQKYRNYRTQPINSLSYREIQYAIVLKPQ